MKPKEIRGKLPPYKELKRLLIDKQMSYKDIARKYGVNESGVYHTLKRRAEAYGDPWPLQSIELREAKKHIGMQKVWSHRYVRPELVRAELERYKQLSGKTLTEIAIDMGMSVSVLSNLRRSRHHWLRRDTAHKIMSYIEEHDYIEEKEAS